jgi:hypothetical protein
MSATQARRQQTHATPFSNIACLDHAREDCLRIRAPPSESGERTDDRPDAEQDPSGDVAQPYLSVEDRQRLPRTRVVAAHWKLPIKADGTARMASPKMSSRMPTNQTAPVVGEKQCAHSLEAQSDDVGTLSTLSPTVSTRTRSFPASNVSPVRLR